MTQPFRMQPALPVDHMKTYAISAPPQTHTRVATCEEVECEHQARGWTTTVDVSTELGQRQAKYIESKAGRQYTADYGPDLVTFTFAAGQQCFAVHRVPLDRVPLLIVRDGDWRARVQGQNRRKRLHVKPEDWVDDFKEHQGKINDQIQKG